MSLESTIRMMTEKKVFKEDGHTDVPSAKRQCKTIIEDAQAIMGILDGMNPEDALPTWWTNKLAVASNSMNKMNDYLSNPTEQKNEEYGAGEWGSDELVANYKNATPGESVDTIDEALPPHLAKLFDKNGNFKDKKKQKMYDDMMKRKAKPADVMRAMSRDVTPKGFGPNEALDHLVAEAQEMGMYDLTEETIKVGDYETKHYDMCPGAVALYKDLEPTDTVVKAAKLQDQLFGLEKRVINAKSATQDDLDKAEKMAADIMALAKEMGKEKEHNYIKGHVSKIKELVEEVQMKNVTEGRMKELHMLIDKGMSAEQIAKKMKLDVKTIKALMPEEVQMEDLDNLIEETLSEDSKTMERMGVSRSLVDSVRDVLAGKPKVDRTDIPEEILDDDVADFIGAASKAAAAGKKEFKFGDKTYPVTIKKKTADKISKKMDEDEHEAPSDAKKAKDKKDEKMGKKEPVEIDPELKEALDKDDEPKVKEIIKKLKGASAAHAGQAKDLEKAMSEAEMTDAQMKKREEIVKELKKKEDEFKERYGDRYKEVMYATATKMAMKSVDEIFGLGKKKKPTTSKPAQKRPAPKKRKPGVSVSQATTGTNLGF